MRQRRAAFPRQQKRRQRRSWGTLIRWLLLAGVVSQAVVSCGRVSEDPRAHFTWTVRARALLENGDFGAAERLLAAVVQSAPSAAAYNNLGLARLEGGDVRGAESAWRQALQLDPGDARASYHLAASMWSRQPDDEQGSDYLGEVVGLLSRAVASDPRNAAVSRLYGEVCGARSDSVAAAAAGVEAERLDPGRAGASPRAFGLRTVLLPEKQRTPSVTRRPPRFRTTRLDAQARELRTVHASATSGPGLLLVGTRVWVGTDSIAAPEQVRWQTRPLVEGAILGGVCALLDQDTQEDILLWTRPERRTASAKDMRAQRAELWLARGTGQSFQVQRLTRLVYDIHDAVVLDVDHDGDLDVVVAVSEAPGLRAWRNDGRGNFATDDDWFSGTPPMHRVRAADLDHDSSLDVIGLDGNGSVHVWAGRAHGFSDVTALTGLTSATARALAAADLDADGRIDLLLGNDEALWVYANRGSMRFEAQAAYRDARSGWSGERARGAPVAGILVTDLDNDGRLDVVSQHFFAATAPVVSRPVANRTAAAAGSAAREDASPVPPQRLLDPPHSVRLGFWRNEGFGILTDVTIRSGLDDFQAAPVQPVAADFDRDGDIDLVCVGADDHLRVLWNQIDHTNRRLHVVLIDPQHPSRSHGAQIDLYTESGSIPATILGRASSIGIGVLERADVVRIVWSDGYVQNILDANFPGPVPELTVQRTSRGS